MIKSLLEGFPLQRSFIRRKSSLDESSFSLPSFSVFSFFTDDVKYWTDCHMTSCLEYSRKMADNLGFSGSSAPVQPDTSENAPLLQEQEDANIDPGPPPPFIASK